MTLHAIMLSKAALTFLLFGYDLNELGICNPSISSAIYSCCLVQVVYRVVK